VVSCDAHHLPLASASIDRVFGRQILHYVDLDVVLEELKRVARPGAIFHSTQQVDYDDLPPSWYDTWSALRNATSRQRLSDRSLSSAAVRHGLVEVARRDVGVTLRYLFTDLRHKYGTSHTVEDIRAFFWSWDADARRLFGLRMSDEAVEYSSRFRVSAFELQGR
jgi:SAM-dependent methyltransferase